jgi:hypothetical protein
VNIDIYIFFRFLFFMAAGAPLPLLWFTTSQLRSMTVAYRMVGVDATDWKGCAFVSYILSLHPAA